MVLPCVGPVMGRESRAQLGAEALLFSNAHLYPSSNGLVKQFVLLSPVGIPSLFASEAVLHNRRVAF